MEGVERLWTYWALFCGRAVVDTSEFSAKYLSVLPKVIIPYLEFTDPKALSMHGYGVNGDFSARWYGYELYTSEGTLKSM